MSFGEHLQDSSMQFHPASHLSKINILVYMVEACV